MNASYIDNGVDIRDNPTEAQLIRLAAIHVAFGIPGKALSHWTPKQQKSYYDAYRQAIQTKA